MTDGRHPVRVTGSLAPGRKRWLRWLKSQPTTPPFLTQGMSPHLRTTQESPITMDWPTNTPPLALTQSVTFEQIDATGASTPVEAELQYDLRDPYAVTIVFMTGQSQVPWRFSRDLLTMGLGLYTPSGDGDVHVWPCFDSFGRPVVIIELCSPEGESLVQAPALDLSGFVDRMAAAVTPGTESAHLNIDAIIAAILDAEAA